ncbi:hypothetical protein HKCCE2091_06790 [Rhodobacterales bacterium HKCCE2091]|nr:hypothetical protein [Rhodobacterales bacterium HKCCE2091]
MSDRARAEALAREHARIAIRKLDRIFADAAADYEAGALALVGAAAEAAGS